MVCACLYATDIYIVRYKHAFCLTTNEVWLQYTRIYLKLIVLTLVDTPISLWVRKSDWTGFSGIFKNLQKSGPALHKNLFSVRAKISCSVYIIEREYGQVHAQACVYKEIRVYVYAFISTC